MVGPASPECSWEAASPRSWTNRFALSPAHATHTHDAKTNANFRSRVGMAGLCRRTWAKDMVVPQGAGVSQLLQKGGEVRCAVRESVPHSTLREGTATCIRCPNRR